MQLPQNILSHWAEFVADWCLGLEPAESPYNVDCAFDALRRLWPEYLDQLQAQDSPGVFTVNIAINRGLTIAACESLRGFQPAMARLRRGEESAFAELQFAAALVRSGLVPELEPQLGSKRLDCAVDIGSERVFAEVISPETSEAVRGAEATIKRVANELVARTAGTRTELLLAVEPDNQFDSIIATATTTLPDEAIHYIEGLGWIHRMFLGPQPPNLGSLIFNPDPRPATAVSSMRGPENGIFTAAVVRLPVSDERMHRLLSAELSHFSQAERNILVVRVSSGPKSISLWVPLIRRWFQPKRNRRVGAIVLYDQAQILGSPPTIRQRWHVIKNPYAYISVPDSLIYHILLRDESSTWEGDTDIGYARSVPLAPRRPAGRGTAV